MIRMRSVFFSMVLFVGAACGDGGPAPYEGALIVGGGAEDGTPGFVDLADDQDVNLVFGLQGGFHVMLNVRVDARGAELLSENPRLSRTAYWGASENVISVAEHQITLSSSSRDGFRDTSQSIQLFLCPGPDDIPIADELLILEFTATNPETGEAVSGQRRIVPRCPSGENNAVCQRICFG